MLRILFEVGVDIREMWAHGYITVQSGTGYGVMEMKTSIEIMDTVTVSSRGQEVTVDVTKLDKDIIAQLVVHGLTQKVADAASAAAKLATVEGETRTPEQITVDLMNKAIDGLYAGEWTRRTDGVSEETRVARSIVRGLLKAKHGAKSEAWAKFTGLSDDEQNKKLDEIAAKNADALADKVKEEIARREAARKAKQKLTAGIEIDL